MKRAYFVSDKDCEFGIVVIANNSKEAKRIGICHDCLIDFEFIDIRVKWSKNVDASNLPIGIVEGIEGLKLGIYGFIEGGDCPKCGSEGFLTNVNGEVMCVTCEDKQNCVIATDGETQGEKN